MKKSKIFLFILLIFFIFLTTSVIAESAKGAILTVNGETQYFQKKFEVPLTINFESKESYHNQLYLSYHLYNGNDEEILYECSRLPIPTPTDSISQVQVKIDLGSYQQASRQKTVKIKFDIVDEKNAFWYSMTEKLDLNSAMVTYENNLLKKMYLVPLHAVKTNYIIFLLNLVVVGLFSWGVWRVKKMFR